MSSRECAFLKRTSDAWSGLLTTLRAGYPLTTHLVSASPSLGESEYLSSRRNVSPRRSAVCKTLDRAGKAGYSHTVILPLWLRAQRIPIVGPWFFHRALAIRVPYTGSISPKVVSLEVGRSVVEMRDRRVLRNHLDSLHAVALMNLAEAATGLALMSALPDSMRAILVRFEITFVKKARGTIRAFGNFDYTPPLRPGAYTLQTELQDNAGEVVATAAAEWNIREKS